MSRLDRSAAMSQIFDGDLTSCALPVRCGTLTVAFIQRVLSTSALFARFKRGRYVTHARPNVYVRKPRRRQADQNVSDHRSHLFDCVTDIEAINAYFHLPDSGVDTRRRQMLC